jgi:hypothetical protein
MVGRVRIVSPTVFTRFGIKNEEVVNTVETPDNEDKNDVWIYSEKLGKPVALGYYDYETVYKIGE